MLIVGCGPIGCELGQAFARLGTKVSMVCKRGSILGDEDSEVKDMLTKQLREDGVEILFDTSIQRFESMGEGIVRVHLNGQMKEVDSVLFAVGRTPNVESMGLEAAGIKHDPELGI